MRKLVLFTLIAAALLLAGCTTTGVIRLSDSQGIDLSGYWNDSDVQIVSKALIKDCISSSWLRSFKGKPVIIIGRIINSSSEHIDTAIISKKVEIALIESNLATTVADYDNRDLVIDERTHQQYYASEGTAAALGNEIGADYFLQGSVRTNLDQVKGKAVRTYYVSLELIDIETSAKVWVGEKTVKKYITKAKYTF